MWWTHCLGYVKKMTMYYLYWQDFISLRKTPDVLCNVIDSSDFPGSPCFKSTEPSFVVARSSYLGLSDFSPMVHSFGDMADKDTWTKLNKGFVADLDKIQFTPAVRSQPTPLTTPTMVSRYIYFKIE